MNFNFFNGKFISLCCIISILLLIYYVKTDFLINKTISEGDLKTFYVSKLEFDNCKITSRSNNRIINVNDSLGKEYEMYIDRRECLNRGYSLEAFYLEGDKCVHKMYSVNSVVFFIEMLLMILLSVYSIYSFFKSN